MKRHQNKNTKPRASTRTHTHTQRHTLETTWGAGEPIRSCGHGLAGWSLLGTISQTMSRAFAVGWVQGLRLGAENLRCRVGNPNPATLKFLKADNPSNTPAHPMFQASSCKPRTTLCSGCSLYVNLYHTRNCQRRRTTLGQREIQESYL